MPEHKIFNYLNNFVTATEHGGPFNIVAQTRPKKYRDAIFWDHDVAYGNLGSGAYFRFNQADQDLLHAIRDSSHPGDTIPRLYFNLKKAVAIHDQDIIMPERKGKRLRGGYGLEECTTSLVYDHNTMPAGMDIDHTPATSSSSKKSSKQDYSPATGGFFTPGSDGSMAHDALIRFKGTKLASTNKTRGRSFKKHRKQKYSVMSDCLRVLSRWNPKIRWNFVDNAVDTGISATVGKQCVHSDITQGSAFNIALRQDLVAIYQKMHEDIVKQRETDDASAANNPPYAGIYRGNADLVCHGWLRDIEFFNARNTITFMDVYEYVSKEDNHVDLTPGLLWQYDIAKAQAAADYGTYGLAQARSNTTVPTIEATRTIQDPGECPEKIPRGKEGAFYQRLGGIKKTRYKLEPLSSVHHKVFIPGFRIAHDTLFPNDATYAIEGISVLLMVVALGEKCYDNTVGAQQTSYNPVNINTTYKDYTSWSFGNGGILPKYSWTTNPPATFSSVTAPVLQIVAADPANASTNGAKVAGDIAPVASEH